MAKPGDILEEPITKLTIVFLAIEPELLRLEVAFGPGGSVGQHVHPAQEERFEVLEGEAWFRVRRNRTTLRPSESIAVPRGARHAWGNDGSASVRTLAEFRPALRTAELFEDLVALSRTGRLNRKGLPRPRAAIAFAHEYRDEIAAPFVPLAAQRALLGVLGPLASARS